MLDGETAAPPTRVLKHAAAAASPGSVVWIERLGQSPVMAGNSWVDDDWSRDWLFWAGAGVPTVVVAASVALTEVPVWRLVVAWLGLFAVTVAVLGFVRTARRAYLER